MRVLVFGASGFLGAHVYKRLVTQRPPDIDVIGTCSKHSRSEELIPVDLESANVVRSLVREVEPDAVIWCVKARDDADETNLNRTGLVSIVEEFALGSRIIFVSSDAVLPGTEGHYGELATPVRSLGTYWLDRYINAKIEAEMLIRESCSDYCIVRTGPIFGKRVSGEWDSRTDSVLSTLERGERLERPVNLVRTYSHVGDLADSLCELLPSNVHGLIHVGAKTPMTHFDFAMAVAQGSGYPTDPVQGFEISPADAKRRHVRLDTSMDTSWAVECLRTRFRHIHEALEDESMELIVE